MINYKFFINSLAILIFISINSKANDFPTLARSEFVFACMSSNASNRDFMSKCSCAIDEIAKRMNYEEYAQAEAIARLWEGASPREEAFKSVGLSKDRMQKLFRAQAASELECF
tara:strand:+ start:348 stop:689 length:342 start_codon:yes stop_codon:yes gene_type:complete